jgi:dynein heavy chain, axonemal
MEISWVALQVTLLNFMITPGGLEDQLLGVVVAAERPDLEEQRSALVAQGAENARRLADIEDRILEVIISQLSQHLQPLDSSAHLLSTSVFASLVHHCACAALTH